MTGQDDRTLRRGQCHPTPSRRDSSERDPTRRTPSRGPSRRACSRDASRRALLASGASALLAGLAGCSIGPSGGSEPSGVDTGTPGTDTDSGGMETETSAGDSAMDWRETELTDVRSGDTFALGQFDDRPVLVEFFAVWCPICTDQQRALGTLLERTDDVVVVSVNVDPNEDADRVRSHLQDHGFDWRYAVAPTPVTRSLVDEFGTVVTNPPAAPVLRLCPGGAAGLVGDRGVKSADALESAAEQC